MKVKVIKKDEVNTQTGREQRYEQPKPKVTQEQVMGAIVQRWIFETRLAKQEQREFDLGIWNTVH